jgi:hypothetical protein
MLAFRTIDAWRQPEQDLLVVVMFVVVVIRFIFIQKGSGSMSGTVHFRDEVYIFN